MSIFTWVLRVLLALWEIMGAVYLMNNYRLVANAAVLSSWPAASWTILAIAEIILAIGLLVPSGKPSLRLVAPISAICLAIISLGGILLYATYAGFPGMLWGLIPAALLAFVACERLARQ